MIRYKFYGIDARGKGAYGIFHADNLVGMKDKEIARLIFKQNPNIIKIRKDSVYRAR